MSILENIIKFLDLLLETLRGLWDIGLILAERLINTTPYLNTEPVVVLGVAIIFFAVWLRL